MSKLIVLCLLVLCISASMITAYSARNICARSNEEWNECGSACPRTCSEKEPRVCIQVCIPKCQCKRGYIYRDDGECVLPKDC